MGAYRKKAVFKKMQDKRIASRKSIPKRKKAPFLTDYGRAVRVYFFVSLHNKGVNLGSIIKVGVSKEKRRTKRTQTGKMKVRESIT